MKKLNYILIAAALLLATVSCTDSFLERNTNPEEATDEMLSHDGLLTGSAFAQMTRNVIPSYQLIGEEEYGSANYQVVQDLMGNMFAGYTAPINTGFRATNLYNVTAASWYTAMFDDAYGRATTTWGTLDKNREEFPEMAAMGDILKVAIMHRVTDTYGPVPYSQLGTDAAYMTYDSQESIYRSFFTELDAAINTLTAFYEAQPNTTLLERYDNVFSGNVGQWIKFANTLRLRLAMRVVYADEALAMEQAAAAINHSVGTMTTSADIAQLNRPTSGAWEYPLYVIQYSFNDGRAGATIVNYMNGYNDPRLANYFTAGSDGTYNGVRAGITLNANYQNSDLLSRINCTNNDNLMWMAPAEAWFLKAEYYLRNGDAAQARSCYEEGIRVSFSTAGASGADAYIANSSDSPSEYTDVVTSSNSYNTDPTDVPVAWQSGAGFETNLEQIITQKYFAMFPEGQEAWSEFRRTGYPKVIPYSVNNSGGTIDTDRQIRRLNYPDSEYRTNADNVNAGVATLNSESSLATGDNGGTRLWWDKNTRF